MWHACRVMSAQMGPLLASVRAAQCRDEYAVSYPELEGLATALVDLCARLRYPLILPVGAAAERVAGAATIVGGDRTRVLGWSPDLDGERVLLLAVAAVTPLALSEAADRARRLGATEVLACGIDVCGVDGPDRSRVPYYQLVSQLDSQRERTA
jgi:hypothetical protein